MKDFTKEINSSIDALLQLENLSSGKNKLFEKEKNVCLRISLFAIPKVHGTQKTYIKLVHSPYGDNPETCLFVPNRRSELEYKIGTDDLIDLTIDYYKDFLEKHKVTAVKTIMPLKQLQSEYGVFEQRRKLVDRFDLFLCKTSLLYNDRFTRGIGKFFVRKNKEPLGVSFPNKDAPYDPKFNEDIKRILFSSVMKINPFADNYSVRIGLLSQSKAVLKENLKAAMAQICTDDVIPGGFQNVRAIYVGLPETGTVPLYISQSCPKDIAIPSLKSKRKRAKKVVGTISTLANKKVSVRRDGTVEVLPVNGTKSSSNGVAEEEEDDDEDLDEDFDDGSDEEDVKARRDDDEDDEVAFKPKEKAKEGSESESEDDETLERQENRLMNERRMFEGVGESEDDDDEEEEEAEDEDGEEDKGPKKKRRKTTAKKAKEPAPKNNTNSNKKLMKQMKKEKAKAKGRERKLKSVKQTNKAKGKSRG